MELKFFLFAGISLILSLCFIPLVILFCRKISLYDSTNARKIHSGNIPRLGGVAFVFAFIIAVILCFVLCPELKFSKMWPLLISGALIFIFGILDDIFELKAIFKLIVQIIATVILVTNDFRFHKLFGIELNIYVSSAITFFWILGIINAYNLIDGLDGLCGVLSLSGLLTYAILFQNADYDEGTVICILLAASVVGFLVYNWPPAKIFMGDGGSQFLGFMLATIPLFRMSQSVHIFEYNKFLVMLVIVSFPMLDTIAAIWRRIRDHRPIMSPDRLHLHHKLLNVGFTKTHALYFVLLIQIFICGVVILASRINSVKQSAMLLVITYILMIGLFSIIHYINRAVLRRAREENQLRNSGVILNYHEETKSELSGPKVEAVVVEDETDE